MVGAAWFDIAYVAEELIQTRTESSCELKFKREDESQNFQKGFLFVVFLSFFWTRLHRILKWFPLTFITTALHKVSLSKIDSVRVESLKKSISLKKKNNQRINRKDKKIRRTKKKKKVTKEVILNVESYYMWKSITCNDRERKKDKASDDEQNLENRLSRRGIKSKKKIVFFTIFLLLIF